MNNLKSQAKLISLVPVRRGSKGLKNKNILNFCGTPLYLRAVNQGLRVVSGCIVSTNYEEILDSKSAENCQLLRRPNELCEDDVTMDEVIFHAIEALKLDDATIIVLLQATTPLRSDADVVKAIELHATCKYDLTITVTETDSKFLKYGTLQGSKFIPVSHVNYCFSNRQNLPDVVMPNGAVYVFSVESFKRNGGLATENIGAVMMPFARSIDIDLQKDFETAANQIEE
jgi:CMP-N,N'-diacetyllegionaminic acid synthase